MFEQLQNISKLIIKKKILLNFVITNYTWKDKVFNWVHIILAIVAPILSLSQEKNCNDTQSFSSVVISFIVASLIKIKDYVKYDKIRDTAKKQNILYKELYDKIEFKILSLKKSHDNSEEEILAFFKEVKKEYSTIEKSDPDIKDSDKEKYIIECKKLGIEYIDDIDILKRLIIESTPKHIKKREIKKDETQDEARVEAQDEAKGEAKGEARDETKDETRYETPANVSNKKYDNNKDFEWNLERLAKLG
jgi:hypothetical protein